MADNWIGKATARMKKKGTVGSLRKAMGAKKGKPISKAKEKAKLKSKSTSPAMKKKLNFALNVRKGK